MHGHELTTGRTFAVGFDHGEDFRTALAAFCRDHDVKQGYIPMFLAGFSEVEIVGTCRKIENPDAPLWDTVHLTGVEALGCGTIAASRGGEIKPHIHVAVGEKARSANGYTGHLIGATVQFLTEMYIVEVDAPDMTRPVNGDLYDVPLLTFGQ